MAETLTDNEINRLAELLQEAARHKQWKIPQVHPNDRDDLEQSAMRDYALRNKLIGMKVANRVCGVCGGSHLEWLHQMSKKVPDGH